jgi:hypothetical protein
MLAIDVYHLAESTGQRITVGMVESWLEELLGHESGCSTCGLGAAAARVPPASVWHIVSR